MNQDLAGHARLERVLATLLRLGTWLSSLVMAAGLLIQLIAGARGHASPVAMPIVNVGVALLILLPVVRVSVMLFAFVLDRDYRYTAIASAVLTIILLGAWLGWHYAAANLG